MEKNGISGGRAEFSVETNHLLSENTELNLSDFALFLSVMKHREAHRSVLSIIMEDPELEFTGVQVEEVILNRSGKRAIRLDALAEDTSTRRYVTEMQNDTEKDDVKKRSRFYQSLLDAPILKAGKRTKYRQLPSTAVTFITQEDIFGKDLAKYTFTEQCEEVAGLHLKDGTMKIFLNMTSKNGEPILVSLLQYMKKTRIDNPEIIVVDERIRTLDRVVQEVKQSEEWEDVKMSIFSMGIEKGREEGLALGMERGRQEGLNRQLLLMICRKLAGGKDEASIAGELEEPIERIRSICRVAKGFAPGYDVEKIYKALWP